MFSVNTYPSFESDDATHDSDHEFLTDAEERARDIMAGWGADPLGHVEILNAKLDVVRGWFRNGAEWVEI